MSKKMNKRAQSKMKLNQLKKTELPLNRKLDPLNPSEIEPKIEINDTLCACQFCIFRNNKVLSRFVYSKHC